MKRTILEIYALAVCFVSIICFVVCLGVAGCSLVQIAKPDFTMRAYDFDNYQSNDIYWKMKEGRRGLTPVPQDYSTPFVPVVSPPTTDDLERKYSKPFVPPDDESATAPAVNTAAHALVFNLDTPAKEAAWDVETAKVYGVSAAVIATDREFYKNDLARSNADVVFTVSPKLREFVAAQPSGCSKEDKPTIRPSESELTKQRTEAFASAKTLEQRDGWQTLVKTLIIILVNTLAFLIHWRIARSARS